MLFLIFVTRAESFLFAVFAVGVFAYNSGASPSVMGHSADEIAGYAQTISYELFCQITPRVKRLVT
jgi:alanine racemase